MAKAPYKLSCTLNGHESDVRAIASFEDGTIVSTSRDKTARIWTPNTCGGTGYSESAVLRGHDKFVSSVCVLNPTERYPKGFIVTGSNDHKLCVYVPGETKPTRVIEAHRNTVCNLRAGREEGTFLSSSWDQTAKLWHVDELDEPRLTLSGHSAAVWCVADLPGGAIVTGSADKLVLVWSRDGSVHLQLSGHTDCVRDVAVIGNDEFLTCANDATVRHWSIARGTCLGTYYGHENYVYSIASPLNGGGVHTVTSGEDRTLRIWLNGEVDQTITLPAQSVWCVTLLPNGDVTTGSSDGLVRVFSANPERYADRETLRKFEEEVSRTEVSAQEELGGIKIDELPNESVLQQPGQRDGQTIIVREGDVVGAYSWSRNKRKWNRVGNVMGASGGSTANSGKQLYNGIEYDYVFSVDIQDGVPPLKLPYNIGEDPWVAAQKFIHDNGLGQLFLDEVANFIVKNSRPAPVLSTSAQLADPFTGGNRYIPDTAPSTTGGSEPAKNASTSSSMSSVARSYIPYATYLKLEQANVPAILEKLRELNAGRKNDVDRIPDDKLESAVKLADDQAAEQLKFGAIDTLKTLLDWPDEIVFPALDVARLAVLRSEVNRKLCTEELLRVVERHIRADALPSNRMLTFRLLANAFCHEKGESLALSCRDRLLKALLSLTTLGSKNSQVAISTYLLNMVIALNKHDDTPGRTRALNVVLTLLPLLNEPEAVFRALVGMGTLLAATPDPDDRHELIRAVRQSDAALTVLRTMSETSARSKLADCSKEIIDLIA